MPKVRDRSGSGVRFNSALLPPYLKRARSVEELLREQRVKKIYFTGMLTHGQSDFFIQYIDSDSRTVRSYYPGFIFQREEPDGSLKYVIVEVKADNQIEDAVVQAKKDLAQQIAVASGMEYRILKSSDANKRQFRLLL